MNKIIIEIPEDIDVANGPWSDEDVRILFAGYSDAITSLTFVDHEPDWRVRFHGGNVLTEFQSPENGNWCPVGVFVTLLNWMETTT